MNEKILKPSIRFKGFTEAWEQRELGKEGTTFTGLSGKTKEDFGHGDAKFITYMNVFKNPICDPDMVEPIEIDNSQKEIEYGDIFFTTSSETPEEVGMSSIYVENPAKTYLNSFCFGYRLNDANKYDLRFLAYNFRADCFRQNMILLAQGISRYNISKNKVMEIKTRIPKAKEEQFKIGDFLVKLDNFITLHQREQLGRKKEKMLKNNKKETLCTYFEQWIGVYKEGAIRKVTMDKYKLSLRWVKKLAPKMRLCDLDRVTYQKLLNDYAKLHERQTTMDFHHHIKAAILDALDDGLINKDPTRKVIIKGKPPREKKKKYLNQFELHTLLKDLKLDSGINFDWLILLIAKTGMRFSEAIALTPKDFDFSKQIVSINKTWNYKGNGGFQPTKNKSSIRNVQIDWMIVSQFSALIKDIPEDQPIFIKKESIFNSTINNLLERHCKNVGIPAITIHGLRHTHASLLLFGGVSIASVAKRLGHSSMNTTEKTYLHIIQELENKDVDLVMRSLSGLC